MTKKDEIQLEFVNRYFEFTKKTKKNSCIISATGTGKSRIGLLILDKVYQQYRKIYIIVNQDSLRDYTWKEEFYKNDRNHIIEKVQLINYQSIYKGNEDLTDCFIIYDEVDFAIGTPEYSKVFEIYRNIPSLALTGYCAKHKIDELKKYFEVIVEYNSAQAIADGVINDVKFVFVKFDLNKEKTIKVEYNDKITKQRKSFMQSENDSYNYIDKVFRIAYGKYEKGVTDAALGIINSKQLDILENAMKRARNARLNLLYNSESSRNTAIKLGLNLLKNPDNKVLVFSKLTVQCNKINKYTYHSNNIDEINNENLVNFNLGNIRSLGVCSKIDRGANLVGVNNAILESYTSSDTVIEQRKGRIQRLGVDEMATFYILQPYFMRRKEDKTYEVAPTQAVKWSQEMLIKAGYDLNDVEIIDLRVMKT